MKIVGLIGLSIIFYGLYLVFRSPIAIPKLPETWWGPGSSESADKSIRPFRISFPDKDVEDLKRRLNSTRTMPAALQESGWTYGVDGSFLPKIVNYWLNDYNFKEREKHVNRYPQFKTNIQGLDIHFIRAKGSESAIAGKRVVPLLLMHGWPGSIVEFHKLLPMLITPRAEHDFVFEVIAPALPGFGFSSPAIKKGLGSPQIAVVMKNLMLRLGYEKFYTQGGDWGAVISKNLAGLFPQHVLGMHSNMCIALNTKIVLKTMLYSIAPSLFLDEEDRRRMYPLSERFGRVLIEESGYAHIQATKPDTVGIGSSDSPAALAAYILEKFSTGTEGTNRFKQDGGLFEKFSADELIDNLMMYWIPNSMTTAMRIYAETYKPETISLGIEEIPITVPSVCAQFPHEIMHQSEDLLRGIFTNLLHGTRMPRGGHFAALEEPKLLANDVWDAISKMERLRGTKKNRGKKPNEL